MSQTTIPRTPTPEALDDHDFTPLRSPNLPKASFSNSQSQGAMTPPPSTQMRFRDNRFGQPLSLLASPPPTVRVEPPISAGTLFGEVPTLEVINSMNEEELRRLTSELVPALGEARVTAAHSKLQHSLLSIQSDELIKRAEVEHEATKREVQVLQEGSPGPPRGFSPMASPQSSVQRNLHLALSHCSGLKQDNAILKKRLKSSKKMISQLDSENTDLKEQVKSLRQRIKENRDHLNEMQELGVISLSGTPQHHYMTPHVGATPRTPATSRPFRDLGSQISGSRHAFDALLQAANLDGEPTSIPSSTYQSRQKRLHNHMRGAHSLSSLPVTPDRRPVTAEGALRTPTDRVGGHKVSFSAPGTQLVYEQARSQEERESTISVSDSEDEPNQEVEHNGSQASQMASSMLRQTLEAQNSRPDDCTSPSKQPASESKLTQRRLFGHVQKPRGGQVENPRKRKASNDLAKKVSSGSERIGLGIGTLSSPAR